MSAFWLLLLVIAVPAVFVVMNYIRANVPYGEARFDTKTEKFSNDE